MSRPRIVISLDLSQELRRGVPLDTLTIKQAYAAAVEAAQGLPLFAAPTADPLAIEDLFSLADGLLISGGAFDLPPELYGRAPTSARLDPPKPLRTQFETLLLRRALSERRPILAVCGGMQLLNVIQAGTLLQDIGAEVPKALNHEQTTSPKIPDHPVLIEPRSRLHTIVASARIEVNSTHHQAVDHVGDGLSVSGRSPDGVVEAIEVEDHPFALGVQWHPELLDDPAARAIYRALVIAAKR